MYAPRLFAFSTVLLVSVSLALSACGGKDDDDLFGDDDAAGGGTEAVTIDPATAATVNGVVNFEGTPPAPTQVNMAGDPVCVSNASDASELASEVAVDNGKLANVFIYVSKGMEGKSFPAPKEEVLLDQEGCRYHPRVLGVMTDQVINIRNSDATLHNVHPTPKKNKAFNLAQPNKGMETKKSFGQEEVMIPFSCDVHGWMRSYVGVLPHPFFAVSAKDGAFSLKGLPPGTYTITAWHEKLGTQDQTVTVAEKESKDVNFSFKL